jgi:hypothetical protein
MVIMFSLNAFNFYSLLGLNLVSVQGGDAVDKFVIMMIVLFSLIMILMQVRYKGKGNIVLLVSAYMIAAIFMFSVKMHERYLFPVCLLLSVAALLIRDRRLFFMAVFFSVLQTINIAWVLLIEEIPTSDIFSIMCSAVSLLGFIYFTYIFIDIIVGNKIKSIKNYTHIFR